MTAIVTPQVLALRNEKQQQQKIILFVWPLKTIKTTSRKHIAQQCMASSALHAQTKQNHLCEIPVSSNSIIIYRLIIYIPSLLLDIIPASRSSNTVFFIVYVNIKQMAYLAASKVVIVKLARICTIYNRSLHSRPPVILAVPRPHAP